MSSFRHRSAAILVAMRVPIVLAAALLLAGCGSASVAELPPPAEPARAPALDEPPAGRVLPIERAARPRSVADAGDAIAVLSVRARVLELYDARTLRRVGRAPAGIGPTQVVAAGDRLYVVDTDGGALLVYEQEPALELVRRVYLPGSPYGIALDTMRRRLWVTLTARNELVELPAHGRPHPLRRFPTVRQPDSVAVHASSGRVVVTGRAEGVIQVLDPDDPRRSSARAKQEPGLSAATASASR
jgi:hypothetical protein